MSTQEFSDADSTTQARLVNKLYNSKPWIDGVNPIIQGVGDIIWGGADPADKPDMSQFYPPLSDRPYNSPEEVQKEAEGRKRNAAKLMREEGVNPNIFGNMLNEYSAEQAKREVEAVNVKNRGIIGTTAQGVKTLAIGAGEAVTQPLAFIPEAVGAEETAASLKNLPTQVLGEVPSNFNFQVDKDGRIVFDEFNKPKTRLAGSILKGVGQVGTMVAGGFALSGLGVSEAALGTTMLGVNTLSSMEQGFSSSKDLGGDYKQNMYTAVLAAPSGAIDTLGDMVVIGGAKPFIKGLTGANKLAAVSRALAMATTDAVIESTTEGLQELGVEAATTITTGKNQFDPQAIGVNTLVGGIVGGVVGGVKGAKEKPSQKEVPKPPVEMPQPPVEENLTTPAPQEIKGLPAPEVVPPKEPARLPMPPEFAPGEAVSMPYTPSPEMDVRVAQAFERFQKENATEKVFTVNHPSDIPTELLSLMGYEAQVISQNKVLVRKNSTYIPEAAAQNLKDVDQQVDGLQRTLENMPSRETAHELVQEMKDLRKDLAELEATEKGRVRDLAPRQKELVEKVTALKRERKKAATPEERSALEARLTDARNELAAYNTAIKESGLDPVMLLKQRRLEEIKHHLTAMQDPRYDNNRKAIENNILGLVGERNKLRSEAEFQYENPVAERGIKLDTENGTKYVLPVDNEWHVLSTEGNVESTGHAFLADALDAANDIILSQKEGLTDASKIKAVKNKEPYIPEKYQVTPELEKELAERRKWREKSKKEYVKETARHDKEVKKKQKEVKKKQAEAKKPKKKATSSNLEGSVGYVEEGSVGYVEEGAVNTGEVTQDGTIDRTTPKKEIITESRINKSTPKREVGPEFVGEVNFDLQGEKGPSIRDVIGQAIKTLKDLSTGVSLSEGGPKRNGVLGFLNFAKDFIRVAKSNDLPTIIHEVAHAIDKTRIGKWTRTGEGDYSTLPPEVIAGLKKTADVWYPAEIPDSIKIQEGISMFLQHYATGQKVHKDVLNWWQNDFKNADPKAFELVEQLKNMSLAWLNQNSFAALEDFTSGKAPSKYEKLKALFTQQGFTEAFLNDDVILGKVDKLSNQHSPETKANLQQIYRRISRNAHYTADYAINTGIHDLNGNILPDALSLKTALSPARGNYQLLTSYMAAKRALAYNLQGLRSGASSEDAYRVITEVQQKHPEIVQAANNVWQWQMNVLDSATTRSPYMKVAVDTLKRQNREITGVDHGYYLPFSREGKDGKTKLGGVLKGDTARIVDPLQNLGNWATKVYTVADRRYVLEEIARLADPSLGNGLGVFVRKLSPEESRAHEKLAQDALQKVKADEDAVLTEEEEQALQDTAALFAPNRTLRKGAKGYSVYAIPEGNRRTGYYEIADNLLEVFNPDIPTPLIQAVKTTFAVPKEILRAGATTFSAPFQLMNGLIRDPITSYRRSKYVDNPVKHIADVVEGLARAAWGHIPGMKEPYTELMKRLSVGQSLSRNADETINRLLTEKTGWKVVDFATTTANQLMDLLSVGEFGNRLGPTIRAMKELGISPTDTLTPEQALLLRSVFAESTTDFSIQGKVARTINIGVPFFTARIAELRNLPGDIKNAPTKHAVLALGYLAAGLALAAKYHDEEWYQNIDPETHTRFALFPMQVGDQTRLGKIPLDTLGMLGYGMGAGLYSAMARNDELNPEATDWLKALASNAAPAGSLMQLVPQIGKVPLELLRNENSYTGRKIVPKNLEDAPAKNQITENTTEFAKKVGDLIGYSPIKIDYLIRGNAPAVANAISYAEKKLGVKKEVNPDTNFLIESFLHYAPTDNVMNRGMDRFYEQLGALRDKKELGETSDQEDKYLKRAQEVQKNLSDISKVYYAGGEANPALRKRLLETKSTLLKEGLKLLKMEDAPKTSVDSSVKAEAKKLRKKKPKNTEGD